VTKDLTGDDLIDLDLINSDSRASDLRKSKDNVVWSTEYQVQNIDERRSFDRREGADRRQHAGRGITVPDMRINDRRMANDRRRVRLTITGRAMDV